MSTIKCLLVIGFFAFPLVIGIDVEKLLKELDDTEKCGQMTQVTINTVARYPENMSYPLDMDKLRKAIVDHKVGSILNTPYDIAASSKTWQEIIKTMQDIAFNETSKKIPILFGIDSIHGANYIQEATLFHNHLA